MRNKTTSREENDKKFYEVGRDAKDNIIEIINENGKCYDKTELIETVNNYGAEELGDDEKLAFEAFKTNNIVKITKENDTSKYTGDIQHYSASTIFFENGKKTKYVEGVFSQVC
jgi:hypothetical protein